MKNVTRRRMFGTLCALAGAVTLASATGANAAQLGGQSEKRCALNESAAGQTCLDNAAWRTN